MPRLDDPESDAALLADGALGERPEVGTEFARLVAVMARIRRDDPWDAEQTHRSLVKHLVEESSETIDAIEAGSPADLREELGDLLFQVCFQAEIARQDGWFDVDDVARGIVEKMIRRHPYVFGDAQVPDDMLGTWEARKRIEKSRTSCLEGIADAMPTLARASKVVTRVRDVHLDGVLSDAPGEPLDADELGRALLALVVRAAVDGVDPDQALRDAVRALETQVRAAEAQVQPPRVAKATPEANPA